MAADAELRRRNSAQRDLVDENLGENLFSTNWNLSTGPMICGSDPKDPGSNPGTIQAFVFFAYFNKDIFALFRNK